MVLVFASLSGCSENTDRTAGAGKTADMPDRFSGNRAGNVSGSDAILNESSYNKLEKDMTIAEVSRLLEGAEKAKETSIGDLTLIQWVERDENDEKNVRTIVCNFIDGKLATKEGANLPRSERKD